MSASAQTRFIVCGKISMNGHYTIVTVKKLEWREVWKALCLQRARLVGCVSLPVINIHTIYLKKKSASLLYIQLSSCNLCSSLYHKQKCKVIE